MKLIELLAKIKANEANINKRLNEGWSLSRICAFLSNRFGEKYYESDGEIYRWNKIPPFDPHRITNYE